MIGAGDQFIIQLPKVVFQILLEGEGAGAVALILAAIEICLYQIFKRKFSMVARGIICGRHEPGLGKTCCCCSGYRC